MEYEIQLADAFEALVEGLDEDLDEVEDAKLRLGAVHTKHEVECGVVTVYQLVVGAADEAATKQCFNFLGHRFLSAN